MTVIFFSFLHIVALILKRSCDFIDKDKKNSNRIHSLLKEYFRVIRHEKDEFILGLGYDINLAVFL
jgi:hypothetical protein